MYGCWTIPTHGQQMKAAIRSQSDGAANQAASRFTGWAEHQRQTNATAQDHGMT
jgi:hypothetical protein